MKLPSTRRATERNIMASGAHKVDITWDRRPAGVVAHLVFDNARRLNVLNPPALLDLTEAFLSLAREDDLRVIVFSGAGGRAFIGGADINHMVGMKTSEDGRRFITLIHKLCQSIRDCPVPVICRAEGYTLGAGLEVAAACDMRIAADNAHFGMPEVKVGIPSVVEAALLPRLIGWGRTSRLLLTAETIDAAKAEAWGLVEEVVPAAKLDEAVERSVHAIVEATPLAVRAQKRLMRRWERLSLDEAVQAGIDALAQSVSDGEHIERMGAFINRKRK
jgi:enoyl-CoA hydratase/carnithine racemase